MVFIISLKQKIFCDSRINVFSYAGLINCSVSQGSILGLLPFLICKNDLRQAFNETESYLNTDNTLIFYQDKDVEKVETFFKKEFSSLFELFIDNKWSIHFGDDKAKTIFFSRMKNPPKLSISYGDYFLKQNNTVEYLGCYLDSNLNRESMARRVLEKNFDTKLNFLRRLSNYLNYLTMDVHDGIFSWVSPWKPNCKLFKTSAYTFASSSRLVVM